jgi:MFS family permease
MQDVLLEPYGGEVLGLSVSATTLLTAVWASGAIIGFAMAARWLAAGLNPYRMAARGILAGIAALATIIFADPMGSPALFFTGAGLIGFGSGLFAVAMLTAAMKMPVSGHAGRGLALGAWGRHRPRHLDLALPLAAVFGTSSILWLLTGHSAQHSTPMPPVIRRSIIWRSDFYSSL